MPRNKKYNTQQLIGYVCEYIRSLGNAQLITASEVAEWVNREKKPEYPVTYQTFTRSCREAKEYINAYNSRVREAQAGTFCENFVYVTMDINKEVDATSLPEKRRERFLELDHTLEVMAAKNGELEQKVKRAEYDNKILEESLNAVVMENQKITLDLKEANIKIQELKRMERLYVSYIEKYMYNPVMRAQLALAGLVQLEGKQVLPKEYKGVMDTANIRETIQAFMRMKCDTETEPWLEETAEPAPVPHDNKVLPIKQRLKRKLKGLEE